MANKKRILICAASFILLALSACGKNGNGIVNSESGTTQSQGTTESGTTQSQATTQSTTTTSLATEATKSSFQIIIENDYTNEDRNRLLIEDIDFLARSITERHPNPFGKISQQEFQKQVDALKAKVDKIDNVHVFIEMESIVASIGDAHTHLSFGTNRYFPFTFGVFGDGIYVINASEQYKDLLYMKLKEINGHAISDVRDKVRLTIAHENEHWVNARLPYSLCTPYILEGLDIIPDFRTPVSFAFEDDGVAIDREIAPVNISTDKLEFVLDNQNPHNIFLFRPKELPQKNYYWYEYLDQSTVYFQYNICGNDSRQPFSRFNNIMFSEIEDKTVEKFIVDLRLNEGGNSSIIAPFLKSLEQYKKENPDLKVFVVIGRNTFSSGLSSAIMIKNASDAVMVGEPSGQSPSSYANISNFELPNLKNRVQYSTTKFHIPELDPKNDGGDTVLPDVEILPTIDDCKSNNDAVLEYIKRLD